MKLAELQKTLALSLLQREPNPVAATLASGSARLSPLEQVEIYREQFWLRHIACLTEDFPTVRALTGDAAFDALCRSYLEAFPPAHFMLRELGRNFAEFLARAQGDALLAEVARVEWAFIDAFDAAEAPALDPAAIAAATDDDWPLSRIRLHPSITLLDLSWPADALREEHARGEPVSRPERSPRRLVVHRRARQLYAEHEPESAFAVLVALAAGATLEAACAHASDAEDKIGEWFSRWAALGYVAAVTFPERELTAASR